MLLLPAVGVLGKSERVCMWWVSPCITTAWCRHGPCALLPPPCADHDLEVKLRRVAGWLAEGHRVQLVVKHGREEDAAAAGACAASRVSQSEGVWTCAAFQTRALSSCLSNAQSSCLPPTYPSIHLTRASHIAHTEALDYLASRLAAEHRLDVGSPQQQRRALSLLLKPLAAPAAENAAASVSADE